MRQALDPVRVTTDAIRVIRLGTVVLEPVAGTRTDSSVRTGGAVENLLLEGGDNLLLENGVGVLLLE